MVMYSHFILSFAHILSYITFVNSFLTAYPTLSRTSLGINRGVSVTLFGHFFDDNISIERISSRNRILDGRVFRGFSISASEYKQKMCIEKNITISEEEAVHDLTLSYDDDGKDTTLCGSPVMQFVAVVSHDKLQNYPSIHKRTNGVIAVIDAQIKQKNKMGGDQEMNLPWPHVSLKNLNVHEDFRRRGIASALVQEVRKFTRDEDIHWIVLEVEYSNYNAITLYQKEGFEFLGGEEGIVGGRMVSKVK